MQRGRCASYVPKRGTFTSAQCVKLAYSIARPHAGALDLYVENLFVVSLEANPACNCKGY
jgi:hypothetical protein